MSEEELQESGDPIDFTEIKGLVRRRRWQFLLPFFFGWVLVWGASWLIPSTYRSGTLILLLDYFIPRSVRTLGFSSPAARTSWHAEQSFVMVCPSALVWLPSWQRKQPGESLCPRLFG